MAGQILQKSDHTQSSHPQGFKIYQIKVGQIMQISDLPSTSGLKSIVVLYASKSVSESKLSSDSDLTSSSETMQIINLLFRNLNSNSSFSSDKWFCPNCKDIWNSQRGVFGLFRGRWHVVLASEMHLCVAASLFHFPRTRFYPFLPKLNTFKLTIHNFFRKISERPTSCNHQYLHEIQE